MADLTFTIPDDKVGVILDAYAFLFNYQRYTQLQMEAGEQPIGKAAFVREQLRMNLTQLAREGHKRKLEAESSVGDIELV